MYMGKFWSDHVTKKMSAKDVKKQFPGAIEKMVAANIDPRTQEFAYDVIPGVGPGGLYSDEDAVNHPEDGDPDDIYPTVQGDKDLMAYDSELDELYVFTPGSRAWLMWNY